MKKIVRILLRALKFPKGEIDFLFLSPAYMATYNKKYLDRPGPTDVISFPVGDFPSGVGGLHPLGDIVICLRVVERYAKKHGIDRGEELTRVIIHGILHLLGYDHDVKKRETIMKRKEEDLLKLVGSKWRSLWC